MNYISTKKNNLWPYMLNVGGFELKKYVGDIYAINVRDF